MANWTIKLILIIRCLLGLYSDFSTNRIIRNIIKVYCVFICSLIQIISTAAISNSAKFVIYLSMYIEYTVNMIYSVTTDDKFFYKIRSNMLLFNPSLQSNIRYTERIPISCTLFLGVIILTGINWAVYYEVCDFITCLSNFVLLSFAYLLLSFNTLILYELFLGRIKFLKKSLETNLKNSYTSRRNLVAVNTKHVKKCLEDYKNVVILFESQNLNVKSMVILFYLKNILIFFS